MKNKKMAPIGVFDSGVGGLTVAREISRQLPYETLFILGIRRVFHMEVNHRIRSFVFQNRLSVS